MPRNLTLNAEILKHPLTRLQVRLTAQVHGVNGGLLKSILSTLPPTCRPVRQNHREGDIQCGGNHARKRGRSTEVHRGAGLVDGLQVLSRTKGDRRARLTARDRLCELSRSSAVTLCGLIAQLECKPGKGLLQDRKSVV